MRIVVVKATEEHGGLFPRVLRDCYVVRGVELPGMGEQVALEDPDGELLTADAKVERVDPAARTYDVRIW